MPVGTSEPGPHPECYQVLQGSAASPEPQPEVQMEKFITEMTLIQMNQTTKSQMR